MNKYKLAFWISLALWILLASVVSYYIQQYYLIDQKIKMYEERIK